MANATQTFTGISTSAPFKVLSSGFDILINAASWSGNSVQIEKQFPGDATWYIVSQDQLGTPAIYTQNFNGPCFEPNGNMLWRLNCTAWTSTISYRIGG